MSNIQWFTHSIVGNASGFPIGVAFIALYQTTLPGLRVVNLPHSSRVHCMLGLWEDVLGHYGDVSPLRPSGLG
jgi:hypothetical protein